MGRHHAEAEDVADAGGGGGAATAAAALSGGHFLDGAADDADDPAPTTSQLPFMSESSTVEKKATHHPRQIHTWNLAVALPRIRFSAGGVDIQYVPA
jgi:hypothetical protein